MPTDTPTCPNHFVELASFAHGHWQCLHPGCRHQVKDGTDTDTEEVDA